MKKKTIFLIILASLFGIGILLTALGIAMGGRFRTLSIETNSSPDYVSDTLTGVSLTDNTDIKELHLDVSKHFVEIRTGNAFSVDCDTLTKNEVKDGIWYIEATSSAYDINIFGYHLYLPFFGNVSEEKLILTIPQNVTLQCMDFDLSAVEVKAEQLYCDNALIDLSAGGINVDNLHAQTAQISVSAGSMKIKEFQITQNTFIDCSMGDFNLGTKQNRTQNFCNNLSADCSMGDLDIYGKVTGESILDCSMGDISAKLMDPKSSYRVTSSANMGNISENKSHTNEAGNPETELVGSLQLDCSMGDINIEYY